ncbi:MAG TPA: PIG-L family deacetylase [Candidatus Limnocylindrales bacterium]|nr:PIG-L family deacetylase [Candidatus Limnocylindrales bacterium]
MGACLVAACCHRIDPGGAEASVLRLSQNDRVLVLAPHPDDEVLCCGGLLQRAVERQLPIRVVFLTLGDSNEWSFLAYRKRPTLTGGQARAMGRLRAEEALEAAERLGVAPEAVSFLCYPDHRGLALFLRAWGDRSPVRGRLTRARAVPYERALRTGAPHRGEEVLEDLGWLLSEFRPTRIFVSHPADHHADHEAFYLFTMVALWEARGEISASVHPYLIHYPAWSLPTGHQPQLGLSPPAQLHATRRWHTFPLSEAEIAGKRHALEAHRTQFGYSARRLLRFVRANELFAELVPARAGPAAVVQDDDEGGPEVALEAPELVPAEALEDFFDVERWSLRDEGDHVEVTIELDRALRSSQRVSLHVLGAREDRPFAEMPKIEVRVWQDRFHTLERGRRERRAAVELTRRGRQLVLRVPMAVLGDPHRLLVGVRGSSRAVPLDRVPWRIVELASGES